MDPLARALTRAAGARPIGGNRVRHFADSPQALAAMLALIDGATARVHLENYIIRDDRTGQRFAEALLARAAAGVAVRVLYDALGSIGTPARFWRALRAGGVEVRAFRPFLGTPALDWPSRDHRKLVVADGAAAILGGLCIGDEWADDAGRGRAPWRDTALEVAGPAALRLEQAFARTWAVAGAPLAGPGLNAEVAAPGDVVVRVVDGVPGEGRLYRAAQLAFAAATERLWVTDAYLVAPPPLWTALLDASRGGVDVRVLVPSTSDVRLVRDLTRIGYRDLLHAGVRVFEWAGPMLHAKCILMDRRWTRIGSSNLNASSLYANYELDVVVESEGLAEEVAAQFRRDIAQSTEIVLRPRPHVLRRLTEAPGSAPVPASHHRGGAERRIATLVTLVRVRGGLRRAVTGSLAAALTLVAVLLVLFPTVSSSLLAAGALIVAIVLAFESGRRRSGAAAGPPDS